MNTYTFDPKLGSQKSSLDLFDTKSENIDILKEALYSTFRGQTLTALEVFESHQIKTLYSRSHYTEALRRLVNEGRVSSWYTDGKRHSVKVLLNEDCHVKF